MLSIPDGFFWCNASISCSEPLRAISNTVLSCAKVEVQEKLKLKQKNNKKSGEVRDDFIKKAIKRSALAIR
jgi:hypothetical protein